MSDIFVSHSSADNAAAAELKARLAGEGHDSVFLDFDPAAGIPAGRDWEKELYERLRDCQAVIVLCSEHSMASRWCFVEIAHAKALGKHIFPVKIADCAIDPVLTSRQVLDLTADPEEAYGRLWRGLKAAGLDPAKSFQWDRNRPPYPGLLAFQEEDAAIFFGREPEIRQGLDALQRLRRFGGARALLVFGASGTGKSSLVRAGLLPRLRRGDDWLVVPPLRPLGHPLRELATALALAFAEHGSEKDWRELHERLEAGGDALGDVARDLRLAARRPEATVLLTVDQAEELTGGDGGSQAEPFLGRLRAAVEAPASPLMVIFTVRADLLGTFHKYPAVRGFEMADLRVGPVPKERLLEIVEGPARLARLELEDGLARAMVAETETDDALPLLAFALRELWDRRREDGKLTLASFRRDLGGLAGSVARAAEAVYTTQPPGGTEEKVRAGFLALARIDERGEYARRTLPWSAVPEEARELQERFVDARLLTMRGDGEERAVEVAHEALFRSWDRLRSWLDENREVLLWRKRIDPARQEWERGGRDPEALLRGPALGEARMWLERHGGQLPDDEREYVAASVRAEARRRRRKVLSLAAAFVFLAAVAAALLLLYTESERRRAEVEDLTRIAVADDWIDLDPTRAALVLLDVRSPETTTRALAVMSETLQRALAYVELGAHDGRVSYAAFSADGQRVLTASDDGTARLWNVDGTPYLDAPLGGERDEALTAEAFSPDGSIIVTAYEDGLARLWSTSGIIELRGHRKSVTAVAFSPDGSRVVTASEDGTARLWTVTGELEAVLEGHLGPLTAVAFSSEGVVTASEDGTARLWTAAGELEAVLEGHLKPLTAVAFSPDGSRVVTASQDETARLWTADGELLSVLAGHEDEVTAVAFSPDGTLVATASEDGTARVWRVGDGSQLAVLKGHEDALTAIAFSLAGDRLVTASEDQTARVWSVDGKGEVAVLLGHDNTVRHAAFSPDGRRVVTASWDGTARIWIAEDPILAVVVEDENNEITAAAFSAGGRRLVTDLEDHTVHLWKADPDSGVYGWPVVLGAHEDTITSAAFSADGRHVITGSEDATARVWNADGPGAPPVVLAGHDGTVTAVAFSPDGALVVTGSEDATARVWRLDGRETAVLTGHGAGVAAVAFSADGRRVITGSEDATARIWGIDGTPLETLTGHFEMITGVALLDAGAVTCSADRTTKLWPATPDFGQAALLVPIEFPEHSVDCRAIAWSADGSQLATIRGRGTIWVRRILPVVGRARTIEADAEVLAAAFTADGERLLTVAEDGTVRQWYLSASRLREEIERTTRVCLAPELRERMLGESAEVARRKHEECLRARRGGPSQSQSTTASDG